MIRRCAKISDVVIAVTPNQDGHRLSSWAKITAAVSTETFSKRYSKSRPDNIYELLKNGKYARRKSVKHKLHNKEWDIEHDLGKRGENARFLVSKDFYAFGNRALNISDWTRDLSRLRGEIRKLGRAFRDKFDHAVEKDLERLEKMLEAKFRRFHNTGFEPRHAGLNLPRETKAEEKKITCIRTKAN